MTTVLQAGTVHLPTGDQAYVEITDERTGTRIRHALSLDDTYTLAHVLRGLAEGLDTAPQVVQ